MPESGVTLSFWCSRCGKRVKQFLDTVSAMVWQYIPKGWTVTSGVDGLPHPLCPDCKDPEIPIDMAESWPQKLARSQHRDKMRGVG